MAHKLGKFVRLSLRDSLTESLKNHLLIYANSYYHPTFVIAWRW